MRAEFLLDASSSLRHRWVQKGHVPEGDNHRSGGCALTDCALPPRMPTNAKRTRAKRRGCIGSMCTAPYLLQSVAVAARETMPQPIRIWIEIMLGLRSVVVEPFNESDVNGHQFAISFLSFLSTAHRHDVISSGTRRCCAHIQQFSQFFRFSPAVSANRHDSTERRSASSNVEKVEQREKRTRPNETHKNSFGSWHLAHCWI